MYMSIVNPRWAGLRVPDRWEASHLTVPRLAVGAT